MEYFKFFRCAAGDDANAVISALEDIDCSSEIVENVSNETTAIIVVYTYLWHSLDAESILDLCGVEVTEVMPTEFADVE